MLATNPEDRASTKIGIKLGGILSVTLSLAVGLACSSPASPIVDVQPPEPALSSLQCDLPKSKKRRR